MNITLKRLFSLLLVLTLVGSMVPAVHAQSEPAEAPTVFTDEDYAPIDAIFDEIDTMEDAPARKNATEAQLSQAAEAIVVTSDSYVEGSLERNGNSFTWWTENGVHCVYSPRMRQIESEMVAPENPIPDGIYNEPVATKGGWPSGNQVYLVGPYYGYDTSFTNQYKNEATAIASAIGDTDGYTLYSGTACTVNKVADAISNGAVVIFDSHGSTNYESGYDYVTGATSSYLCLTSTSGLTSKDYNDGALYYSDGIWINGATISNHMTSDSPAGILWMAICLGMATDTMCEPLRERGVEVVYGYSQSVSFDGDYCFEEVFWDNMCAGKTVAEAVSAMKAQYGNWDGSPQIGEACKWDYYGWDTYSTISAARADYAAFPIVVSDEDSHPGQRNGSSFYGADSLQTVQSTYTLFSQYDITATSNNTAYGTVSISGSTITATPKTGCFTDGYTVLSGNAAVTQNGNSFTVIAESDCAVQINFAPKSVVTVSFSGAAAASQAGYAGDSMSLPAVTAPDGYTFVGWMTSPMGSDSTEKPACYTDSFIPTASTTLYALYSYVDENSGTGTGDFVKVTAAPDDWSGEYVIVYEAGGLIFDGSLTTFDAKGNYQSVTISNNTISATEAEAYKFTIAPYSTGYSVQGTSGKYIGHSSNANKITTTDTEQLNKLSFNSNGSVNIICAGGAYLRFNSGDSRFRYYKSSSYSNQKAVALYVKDGSAGVTWYTSLETAEPAAAVYNGTTLAGEYADLAEAIASCAAGQYIKLLANAEAEVILEQDLYIDLNGFDLTGILEPDGHSVYGIDSTTDGYNSNNVGIFNCLDINDQPVVPQTHIKTDVTGSVKRYLAVKTDDGYTFHRFYLGITHATVRPGSNGVGYKALFCGDDTVKAQLASYGYSLQVGTFQARTVTKTADSFVSGNTVTLRIENYDAENYGDAALTAVVTLTLTDGTVIESASCTTSLRQIVEAINANASDYTAEQLAALKEMIENSPTMSTWDIGNI